MRKVCCISVIQASTGVEGYRLEGMDNPPPVLQDYVDTARSSVLSAFVGEKKLRRMVLQRLNTMEIIRLLLDTHTK
jgi:hypothetical protein